MCFFSDVVFSQQEKEKGTEPGKKRGREVEFLLLGGSKSRLDAFLFETPESEPIGPINMFGVRLSNSVRVTGSQFALAVADETKESGFRMISSVTLDKSNARAIILLEAEGDKLKPHLINSSDSRFGNNSTLFYNLSKTPIGVTMGKNPYLIKPGEMKITPVPDTGDDPYYFARFAKPSESGKPIVFSTSKWPVVAAGRNYIFFYDYGNSGKIVYGAVEEKVPEFRR